MSAGGIVAAGHPRSAEAGAQVLRDGGNAVDAALGAMLTAFVCEPQLTGFGAGGYMLVAGFGDAPVLLDFFVAAPGHGSDGAVRADPVAVEVDFGGALQTFNCGPATVGAWGNPAGICEASRRWGSVPLADLATPAARAGARGRAAQRPAGLHLRAARGDPRAHARDDRAVCARWACDACGRRVRVAGHGRRARAPRRRGRGAVLHGGHRRGRRPPPRGGRRRADARRPCRLRRDRPRPGARDVPRPHRADQPTAERRRRA